MAMETKSKETNSEIENRIEMEIVVDAYDQAERAMGWYYYLQDNLSVPFKAECILSVSTSPLKLGEVIDFHYFIELLWIILPARNNQKITPCFRLAIAIL